MAPDQSGKWTEGIDSGQFDGTPVTPQAPPRRPLLVLVLHFAIIASTVTLSLLFVRAYLRKLQDAHNKKLLNSRGGSKCGNQELDSPLN